MAEAQAGHGEGSDQRVVLRESFPHLREKLAELLWQKGIAFVAVFDGGESNPARRISNQPKVVDCVLNHRAKYATPTLDSIDSVAVTDLSVDPFLDLHRSQLSQVYVAKGLEHMVVEGVLIPSVCARIDQGLLDAQPVTTKFLDSPTR